MFLSLQNNQIEEHTHTLSLSWDLQSSGVSRCALALSGDVVTGGSVLALAFLLAPVPVGAGLTRGLAAPPSEPREADAGSSDGVTQSLVLTLTSVTAVRPPVVTVTR